MKRASAIFLICAFFVSLGTVTAADVSVYFRNTTLEWDPNPLYINYGDRVVFKNCTYVDFYVQQLTGTCDPWQTTTIGGGAPDCGTGFHTFTGPECPENGTEVFIDSGFFETCTIIYINPTPTPTPTWYYFPSTTPTGLGITLAAMGILMMIPALRRHRRKQS